MSFCSAQTKAVHGLLWIHIFDEKEVKVLSIVSNIRWKHGLIHKLRITRVNGLPIIFLMICFHFLWWTKIAFTFLFLGTSRIKPIGWITSCPHVCIEGFIMNFMKNVATISKMIVWIIGFECIFHSHETLMSIASIFNGKEGCYFFSFSYIYSIKIKLAMVKQIYKV